MSQNSSIRSAALDMARRGFRIFPLQPHSKDVFEAKLCSKEERPLSGGVNRSTRDPNTINEWFDLKADINYGVDCRGMTVIDVDVKDDQPGLEQLRAIGTIPLTFTVLTPSKGLHIYYTGAEVGQRKLRPCIDIRSRGGYVVGPGCVFNDRVYRIIEDAPLASLPDNIYEECGSAADPSEKQMAPVAELDQPLSIETATAFAKQEPVASVGDRNTTAFCLACQLKDFGLSAETIAQILIEHWNSRNPEPLPDSEIEAVAENAFKSGRYAPGVKSPSADFEDLPEQLREIAANDNQDDPNFALIDQRLSTEIPTRPWFVPGFLIRSSLTALVAQPGARKSTFTIGLACGVALGDLSFMGLELRGDASDVMIINNEDDEDEIDRRVAACCFLNKLDYKAVKKRLHIHKARDGSPFVAAGKTVKGGVGVHKRFAELKGYMKVYRIGLIILDPLADIHHVNENDNSEMAQVMSYLRALVRGEQAAGLIVHHSRKPANAAALSDAAGDPFSSRGASAIHGNVRVLATLSPASEADAIESLGISPPHHLKYTRFDLGKGSYSEPGKHTKWFECEGVHVGPPDGSDTAPALRYVNRSDQVERQINAIHKAICNGRDKIDKEGFMSIEDAVRCIQDEMMEIDSDLALRYLASYFRKPVERNGVTVSLENISPKKKAVAIR